MPPLISVIIPVYNGAATIQKTIASVLNQTFANFEIIVVNDGSTDATLEVLKTIDDPRMKIFSYPNGGVSASRNRGIAQAKGEYLSFLDADDLWTSDKLEKQLAALENTPQAGVAFSWTDWIDESDQFLRPGGRFTCNGNVFERLLIRDFIESGSNPLVRREAIATVGGFDETLTPVADWDMWLRLAAQYEFVTVRSPQILYRVSPSSMSSNVWRTEEEIFKIVDRFLTHPPACLKNTSLSDLKRKIYASRYQFLTIKALEGMPERKKALSAMRYFYKAIYNDPAWLKRTKLMAILIAKMLVVSLLPAQQAATVLNRSKP